MRPTRNFDRWSEGTCDREFDPQVQVDEPVHGHLHGSLRLDQDDVLATDLGLFTLALDLRPRFAHVNDQAVELTARQFTLAKVLLHHPGQVLSREQLPDHVWDLDFDPGSNIVDVYVRYLAANSGPNVSRPSTAWATASQPVPERLLISGSRLTHRRRPS